MIYLQELTLFSSTWIFVWLQSSSPWTNALVQHIVIRDL